MHDLEEFGLTFMILTKGWWGTGRDIRALKRKAVSNAKWAKGQDRVYFLFLVHEDSTYDEKEKSIQFPTQEASEAAIYLGEI